MRITSPLLALLWTLLLVGPSAHAYQYPLQYHYHYRARVTAGIPEINDEHTAASDIRASLHVYATSPTSLIFKIDEVEIADYHGEFDCELDEELPVEYRTPSAGEPASLIGQHAFGADEEALIFSDDDPLWLTNFYKSIVGLFAIQPIRAVVYGINDTYGTQEDAYRIREQSIMGECDGTYTQHKLTGVALNAYNKWTDSHIEEDAQLDPAASTSKTGRKTTGGPNKTRGRKTTSSKRPPGAPQQTSASGPLIDPTVWLVVRSINLEDCDSRVEHQHAHSGIYCDLSRDQCKNKISRNSHSVSYVRGSPEGVRLEKAIVRGNFLVAPFGFDSDMVSTDSYQKLALVSVKNLGSQLPDFGFAKTTDQFLMYRMILPYNRARNPTHSWSNMGTLRDALEQFTAHTITPELQVENEGRALELVKTAYYLLQTRNEQTGPSRVPALLNYVTILLYDFSEEEMASLVNKAGPVLNDAEKLLLSGVLAEVGSVPAVNILLEFFRQGLITPTRQAIFFVTMFKNIKSAEPLKNMMQYLLAQDIDAHPFETSQSLINLASTVNSLCVKYPNAGSFSDYARLQCADDNIVEEFENYAITGLQEADKFWKQMVFVKTLVNIRTANAMTALKPYILGQKDCDRMVRLTAMQAMTSWNAPHIADRQEVALTLLELFENPAEDRHIRAKALSILSSWKLTSTIWSRLAFSTKRPLSKDLGAFTYSLILATSQYKHPEALQQSLYASHALRLARKYSPYKRYSGFKTWYELNFDKKIGSLNYMEYIANPLSPLPSEISLYIRRVFGGTVLHKKMDAAIANDWGDLESIFHAITREEGQDYYDMGERGNWDRFLQMLTSGLEITEKVRDRIIGFIDLIPVTDAQIFIPLEREFLHSIIDSMKFLWDQEGQGILYMNSMDSTLATVNDIGLPVIISVAKPKIYQFQGVMLRYSPSNKEYTVECISCSINYASTRRTHVETMALWSKSKVAAGVSQTSTFNLPIDFQTILSMYHHMNPRQGLTLTLKPSKHATDKPVSLVNFINTPYTVLRGTAPANVDELQANTKLVHSKELHGKENAAAVPLPHGFVLGYKSESTQTLRDFSTGGEESFYTSTFWTLDLQGDLSKVSQNAITLNFTMSEMKRADNAGKYVSKYGQDSFREDELCGAESSADFSQQTGQTAADYYDYTQQSSNDAEFQNFGSSGFSEFGSQQTEQAPQKFTMETASDAEMERHSFGAPDATKPLIDNYMPFLRQNKGWKEVIRGFSVRFSIQTLEEDKSITDTSAIELGLFGTLCTKLQDRKTMKFVYVFGTSFSKCDTICLEGDVNLPKINDLDTLVTLAQKDLSKTAIGGLYMGERCSEGPYMEYSEERVLTDDGLQMLLAKSEDCEEVSNDPVEEFSLNAFYNKIDINATMHKEKDYPSCSNRMLLDNLVRLYGNMQEALNSDSTLSQCLVNSAAGTQRYQATRFLESTFKGELDITPPRDSEMKLPFQMNIPYVVEWMLNKVDDQLPYNLKTDGGYCVINETTLTTFDGMHTGFEIDPCPSLAVSNCEAGSYDKFAVGVSSSRNGGLAVNIVARYRQQIINMDSQGVEINGERMPDEDYVYHLRCDNCHFNSIGHVYRRNGFYKVEIDDTLSVIMKEGKVFIKVAPRYYGYTCGLCGDQDGQAKNDMKQPNGCLLRNSENFRKSWIPSSSFQCFGSGAESRDTCTKEEPLDPFTYTDFTRVY